MSALLLAAASILLQGGAVVVVEVGLGAGVNVTRIIEFVTQRGTILGQACYHLTALSLQVHALVAGRVCRVLITSHLPMEVHVGGNQILLSF